MHENDLLDRLAEKQKECTGCKACTNACPKEAIEMRPDYLGFTYPHIDESACVDCGRCASICPKLNPPTPNEEHETCFAARADDEIRKVSSSGGIFTLVAEEVLSEGGVVCGATMDENYDVRHICVETVDDLELLRQSKYVQSDMGTIYKDIRRHLKNGRLVLFVGCPCQVAAMRNFFPDEGALWLMDFLCHGVPSNKMWKDYLFGDLPMEKIDTVSFRSKLNGWRADWLRVFWKDGSSTKIEWHDSAYEEGFQRNICLRRGCTDCEFAGLARQGDLTIGDFWQVEKHDERLNDGKGTSALLINNERGQVILDRIRPRLIDLTETPIEWLQSANRLFEHYTPHPQADRFLELAHDHSFHDAVWQTRHALYDVGLVGVYAVPNYGAHITYYALYRTIRGMGYSVLMVSPPTDISEHVDDTPVLFAQNPYPEWAQSRRFDNNADMKFLNMQCTVFVSGSDQMWNNYLFHKYGRFMCLPFAMDNHPKIAYAASAGHDYIWGEENDRATQAHLLQRFDAVSVREDSGVELFRREFGVQDAVQVLDPVFLMPIEDYDELITHVDFEPEKPYLFAYILDPSAENGRILQGCAERMGLEVQAITDADDGREEERAASWDIPTIVGDSVESWLAHIKGADFVIVDSFHGMCLSVLFHKPFVTLVNKERGESRFTSIAKVLGLEDRLVYDMGQLEDAISTLPDIDWEAVDARLADEQQRSRNWLRQVLDDAMTSEKRALSTFDLVDSRIDDLWRHVDTRNDALAVSSDAIVSMVDKLQERFDALRQQNEDLYASNSWKVGRAVTWLPRQLKKAVRH